MFVDRRKLSRTKLLIGPDGVPIPEPNTLGELFVTMLIDL